MLRPVALAALSLALAAAAPAAVLRVPSAYPTINAALALAASGDVILVAPGIYNETIVWPSVDGIRLVSESGHAVTTIDAGQSGRVITFDTALTRATVLQGFNITGGYLNGSNNHGAGILISYPSGACSPTIRNNRITGNRCDGTNRSYGGGIHVDGGIIYPADPLIERNVIEQNSVDGREGFGAGIYVGLGGHPDILGNIVRGNQCQGGTRGEGAGMYLSGAERTVVASNVVVDNTCSAGSYASGGGIYVDSSGLVTLANNTVAGNRVSGALFSNRGAGIHFDGVAWGDIHNNIVASNTGAAGIELDFLALATIDYNDVWNNSGGGYAGVAAGPNDISADPLFVGPADYRLQSGSPCVDAGSSVLLPAEVSQDPEGDPRQLDGDRDGLAGNGATVDMGADEAAWVGLDASATAQMGTAPAIGFQGPAGSSYVLFFATATGNTLQDPYGTFLLTGPTILGGGAVPGLQFLPIPNVPALAGTDFHVQALVSSPAAASLTRRLDFTIY